MNRKMPNPQPMDTSDYGPEPYITDITAATRQNKDFRSALWTGRHHQLTLMSIPTGEDIGLEMHPETDQFLQVVEGWGLAKMGSDKDKLNYQKNVSNGYGIFIPAGTWHNLINTGNRPLKLYSLYAPSEHPHGTVHHTKEEAEAAEHPY